MMTQEERWMLKYNEVVEFMADIAVSVPSVSL